MPWGKKPKENFLNQNASGPEYIRYTLERIFACQSKTPSRDKEMAAPISGNIDCLAKILFLYKKENKNDPLQDHWSFQLAVCQLC